MRMACGPPASAIPTLGLPGLSAGVSVLTNLLCDLKSLVYRSLHAGWMCPPSFGLPFDRDEISVSWGADQRASLDQSPADHAPSCVP